MKANQITVGGFYLAKVSNKIVTVRVDALRQVTTYRRTKYSGESVYGDKTVYDCSNLSTGRKITFRSAQKFRDPVPVCDQCHKPFTRFRGDRKDTCMTCLEGQPRSSLAELNDKGAEQRPDPTKPAPSVAAKPTATTGVATTVPSPSTEDETRQRLLESSDVECDSHHRKVYDSIAAELDSPGHALAIEGAKASGLCDPLAFESHHEPCCSYEPSPSGVVRCPCRCHDNQTEQQ